MLSVVGPYLRNQFKKRLGYYSYKIGGKHANKASGMVPIKIVNFLRKNVKNEFRAKLILARMVRESLESMDIMHSFTIRIKCHWWMYRNLKIVRY